MKKIAFIVDSSSGIVNNQYENVFVLPLVINKTENGKITSYYDNIDIKNEKLIALLSSGADIKTSQPSIGEISNIVNSIYDKYDEIYALPIPEKLSGAINSWRIVSEDFSKLKVIPQYGVGEITKNLIEKILILSKKGKLTEQKIVNLIEDSKKKWVAFLIVPTVDQLVKGGRVSNLKSLLIKLLNYKLIITFDYEGLLFYSKSSKYIGCLEIIKKALEKKLDLKKNKITNSFIFQNYFNKEKFGIPELIKLINHEFEIKSSKTFSLPAVITAHVGVEYAAIYMSIE